jgi:hypothetical protein
MVGTPVRGGHDRGPSHSLAPPQLYRAETRVTPLFPLERVLRCLRSDRPHETEMRRHSGRDPCLCHPGRVTAAAVGSDLHSLLSDVLLPFSRNTPGLLGVFWRISSFTYSIYRGDTAPRTQRASTAWYRPTGSRHAILWGRTARDECARVIHPGCRAVGAACRSVTLVGHGPTAAGPAP